MPYKKFWSTRNIRLSPWKRILWNHQYHREYQWCCTYSHSLLPLCQQISGSWDRVGSWSLKQGKFILFELRLSYFDPKIRWWVLMKDNGIGSLVSGEPLKLFETFKWPLSTDFMFLRKLRTKNEMILLCHSSFFFCFSNQTKNDLSSVWQNFFCIQDFVLRTKVFWKCCLSVLLYFCNWKMNKYFGAFSEVRWKFDNTILANGIKFVWQVFVCRFGSWHN